MAESPVIVVLPTRTVPVYNQQIVGKKSPISPDVEEFRGIPFGIVPGRWEHSQLLQCLPQDVFNALHNGPKCPQPAMMNNTGIYQSHLDFPADVTESEFDCLNLFVVRPSAESLARVGCKLEDLPVLVWIHGGGYGFGAGTDPIWDPTRLVMESVSLGTPFIAVGLNYRLNIFGFAASSDIISDQSGGIRGCNFGLRDQKVGLEWVSKNIASFGGDPKKITLGGQSAGACSVHVHAVEAKLKPGLPLFRSALIQSGAVGCLGPISLPQADENWEILFRHLGFSDSQHRSRLSDLRSISPNHLLRATLELGWITFPLVDDKLSLTLGNDGSLVGVDLDEESSNEGVKRKPIPGHLTILAGDTEVEGCIFDRKVSKIQNFETIRSIFCDTYGCDSATENLLLAYGIAPGIAIDVLRSNITRLLTEIMFSYPISRARSFFSQQPTMAGIEDQSNGEVKPEIFHSSSVQSYKVKFGNPFPGPYHDVAHHCVDLIYLFDAFHDDLLATDNPSVESTSPGPATPDSGYLSLPRKGKVSNSALRQDIQRQWINFIVDDHTKDVKEQHHSGKDARILVYGTDRIPVEESLEFDLEWVEQKNRFGLLAEHPDKLKLALSSISSM